jgi:predicted aspartyl protease
LALCIYATIDMEKHLTMNVHMNNVSAVALVDSGATRVFMHPDFAKRCNATIRLKATPREVRVIDGRIISSGLITHEATVDLTVDGH